MSIVLSVLCFILKIIGIVILIPILLLLLFLILPISYRAEGSYYEKKPTFQGRVRWFFIWARISYEEDLSFWIRILGIPIYHSNPEKWSVFGRQKKDVVVKKKKKTTISEKKEPPMEKKKEEEPMVAVSSEEEKNTEDVLELTWDEPLEQEDQREVSEKKEEQKENLIEKIRVFFQNLYKKAKNLFEKLKKIVVKIGTIKGLPEDEKICAAFFRVKSYAFNVLRYLIPQKLEGEITFGLEDPAQTGKILGWLAMGIPLYGDHLDINPDFTGKAFEGHILIAGRIRRYKILRLLWKIYKDKDLIKQKDRVISIIGG